MNLQSDKIESVLHYVGFHLDSHNYSFNYQANSDTEPIKNHCNEHIESHRLNYITQNPKQVIVALHGTTNTIITSSFRHINVLE